MNMQERIQKIGKRQTRSVSMYAHQREAFNRLGGSKWLQEQIERAINETANKSSLASVSNVPMGAKSNIPRKQRAGVPKESVRVFGKNDRWLQPL